ncbi:glutathione peroxidase [Paenibacillus senegalensis]|uniref:glutathione peroxidase n=1 Tax=Paenibacillus senegalensis TaxID=1465766 RepID=UPI000289E554|nr:glutathione peroxidase [Paenibacillus senegalensis]
MSKHSSLYEIEVNKANGQPATLEEYRGKVLLVVNVASQCGFTKQYEGLEALYKQYRSSGLEILAFPSNDFGAQEPGTMEEIQEFCKVNYGVTFPLFEKLRTVGPKQHPLYSWLTNQSESAREVQWNFEKFLVSREGQVLARFESKVAPEDEELVSAIQKAL